MGKASINKMIVMSLKDKIYLLKCNKIRLCLTTKSYA